MDVTGVTIDDCAVYIFVLYSVYPKNQCRSMIFYYGLCKVFKWLEELFLEVFFNLVLAVEVYSFVFRIGDFNLFLLFWIVDFLRLFVDFIDYCITIQPPCNFPG